MADSESSKVVEFPMQGTSGKLTDAPFMLTELGNAQRLVATHGKNIRYVPKMKCWIVWNGNNWEFDTDGEIERLAKKRIRQMYSDAPAIEDDEKRTKHVKWAAASESQKRLKTMVQLAETEPGVPIAAADLDRDLTLLGVKNGVIDLKTGELLKPERKYLITKVAPVSYDPSAQCPKWRKFL